MSRDCDTPSSMAIAVRPSSDSTWWHWHRTEKALHSRARTTSTSTSRTSRVPSRSFATRSVPFEVKRLILGVARAVKSTGAVEELAVQRRALYPIVLDLWDAQELSTLLRDRPEIVIEYFGMPTAEAFCLPFKIDIAHVPSADAAAVREAIARTPEVSTGAQAYFDKAAATTDSADALALVEEGQSTLRKVGFGPHASAHDKERVRLLAATGRADEAARQILDDFWAALDHGLSVTAQMTQSRLDELSILATDNEIVALYRQVIETAINLYQNPLGYVPEIASLRLGDACDQARLILLAGETALAGDQSEWLTKAVPALSEYSRLPAIDESQSVRLRILIAEATDDWAELLTDARQLKLEYGLSGVVTARHARSLALHEKFREADLAWDEASGSPRWPPSGVRRRPGSSADAPSAHAGTHSPATSCSRCRQQCGRWVVPSRSCQYRTAPTWMHSPT